MQIWRRTFATSVGRLTHSSINSRPSIVRCAQILQASKNGAVCSFEDQEVKVNGFIRSVRKQKRFAFAEISDGSTVEPLQAILKPAQAAEYVRPRELWSSTCLSTKTNSNAFSLVCQLELRLKYLAYGKLAHRAKSKPMSSKQTMLRL
jgi:aspartyl/asparaginyl-tRNA synthetase